MLNPCSVLKQVKQELMSVATYLIIYNIHFPLFTQPVNSKLFKQLGPNGEASVSEIQQLLDEVFIPLLASEQRNNFI